MKLSDLELSTSCTPRLASLTNGNGGPVSGLQSLVPRPPSASSVGSPVNFSPAKPKTKLNSNSGGSGNRKEEQKIARLGSPGTRRTINSKHVRTSAPTVAALGSDSSNTNNTVLTDIDAGSTKKSSASPRNTMLAKPAPIGGSNRLRDRINKARTFSNTKALKGKGKETKAHFLPPKPRCKADATD